MKLDTIFDLSREWYALAETLRSCGAEAPAKAIERCAEQLAVRLDEWWSEALSIDEAAEDLGITYDAAQKRISRSAYPNVGRPGSPAVRRCELHGDPSPEPEPRSLEALLDGVLGRSGAP